MYTCLHYTQCVVLFTHLLMQVCMLILCNALYMHVHFQCRHLSVVHLM